MQDVDNMKEHRADWDQYVTINDLKDEEIQDIFTQIWNSSGDANEDKAFIEINDNIS